MASQVGIKDLGGYFDAGGILYHNGASYVRLAKGTDGQVLKMVNGLPAWANCTTG